MNKIIITFFIAIISNFVFGQENTVIQVNSSDFQNLILTKKGALLDVRTKSEFDAEHIEDAGQLNFYSLDFKQKLSLLADNEPIYLYCNTGYRSQKAGEMLVEMEYKNVYNLEHGIMEWNLQEFPVIEGDRSKLNKENKMSVDEYQTLISSEGLVFIDFYATWCRPCRVMMPLIDSLKTEYYGKVKVVKVNSDVSKKLVKELELNSVPYFQLFNNGNLIFEKYGMITRKEIIAIFEEQLQSIKIGK